MAPFRAWMPATRRYKRRRILRVVLAILGLWALIDILTVQSKTKTIPPLVKNTDRVFISALAWNNEDVLREYWSANLIALCRALGPLRVYVSIYESGSYYDDTRGALQELSANLKRNGVDNSIITDETNHQEVKDDMITTPDGEHMPRRIPYLARLRNKSLQPLKELIETGRAFDKILFLNDVVFSVCPIPPPDNGRNEI